MRKLIFGILSLILILSCQPAIVKKTQQSVSGNMPPLYVIKESVNLRSAAQTNSAKIASLEDGTILQILNNKQGWYQVRTDEGQQGWLRSDLAGPREFSLTRMAAAFNDSIMPAYNAELYFDKNDLFKIIYLKFEQAVYKSKEKAAQKAKEVASAYQKKVYHGSVEARVVYPEGAKLYTKIIVPAAGLARIPFPIIPFGRLYSLKEENKAVTIKIALPDSIPKKVLLKAARLISSKYDYPFQRAEIFMVSDRPAGIAYLKGNSGVMSDQSVCRLYYLEDADGEDYKFQFCDN